MPRIRRLKDWDYDENLSTYGDECPAESVAGEGQSDAVSGQSYLSNAAVIASLPDDRLVSCRSYYASMLALLDAEIRQRHIMGRGAVPIAWPSMFETSSMVGELRGGLRREAKRPRAKDQSVRKARKGSQQIKLTPQQMIQALQLLMKMKGTSSADTLG